MSEIKFCKDCKYCANTPVWPVCTRVGFDGGSLNVVTGKDTRHTAHYPCLASRSPEGHCKPSATMFEAKPVEKSIWQRVLDFFLADTRSTGVK